MDSGRQRADLLKCGLEEALQGEDAAHLDGDAPHRDLDDRASGKRRESDASIAWRAARALGGERAFCPRAREPSAVWARPSR